MTSLSLSVMIYKIANNPSSQASNSLRGAIASINQLPGTYKNILTTTVNDPFLMACTQNLLTLLLCCILPPPEAAEVVLHLLYSARLTSPQLDSLRRTVRPLVADVVQKIEAKRDNDTIFSRTWKFGTVEVMARLTKKQWESVLRVLDKKYLAFETERERRERVQDPKGRDEREQSLYNLKPGKRVAVQKMREDGVLLPFGGSDGAFVCVNP